MSSENEVAGSSKPPESTDPDCNAENILTSSTNYGGGRERESPTISTFQALKQKVLDRGGSLSGNESNIIAVAASIPLINSNETNKITNNNNNVINPNKKLFECDVCNMKFSNGANMRRHKMRHTGTLLFNKNKNM